MINPESPLCIAIVQMCSVENTDVNFKFLKEKLSEIESQGVDLVSLPENALYMRITSQKAFGFDLLEGFWQELTSWCLKTGISIHIGAIPVKENGKVTNSTVWVDSKGPRVVYRKVHLFDVEVEGERPIRESDHFLAGAGPEIIEIKGWNLGLSICYDLRFSELYLNYAKQGVHLIMIPSAFLVPTGKAHWHVLLRARAIESQTFVIAAAQAGTHKSESGERFTYGHSLAVDPWGRVIGEIQGNSPGILVVELDPKIIKQVRAQIPMKSHRRL